MGAPVTLVTPDPVTGFDKLLGSAGFPLSTSNVNADTATVVSVVSAVANTLLKAANTSRKGLIITNDSTSILYVLLGAGTASATNYTFAIAAKGTVAADRTITGFTGIVQGFWPAANGNALVTELV